MFVPAHTAAAHWLLAAGSAAPITLTACAGKAFGWMSSPYVFASPTQIESYALL